MFVSEQVASLPTSKEKEGAVPSLYSAAEEDNQDPIYYVLEESSGYMGPCLHLLALAHTLISVCCIIGYYCLKVHELTWNELGPQSVQSVHHLKSPFAPSWVTGATGDL